MKVFIANRLENLVEMMADRLTLPPAGRLKPETVVVQSAGMAKWISMQLALLHGVAANYRFPFPNAFIEEIFRAFIPEYEINPIYKEGVLVWRILDLLIQFKEQEEFRTIRTYLGEENDQNRLYHLANRIARTFDQYLIFRPDMILKWEKGNVQSRDEQWQAILWRNIPGKHGGPHKAALHRQLIDAMKNKPCRSGILPERISVFGISYLPPYHLDILVKLSAQIPLDYYYLNPSREFWADIKSGREINRVLHQIPGQTDWSGHLHLDTGNSLLASWGAQGRDFFRLMEDMPVEYWDLFKDGDRNTLLHKVQDDIYRLSEPQWESGEKEKVSDHDETIQIHACYSPLREVEALHDILLNLFEKDSAITPEDVLVMTPDIEIYAPCIEAVFEAREPKIPYSIADRPAPASNVIVSGLLSILDMADSRFKAGDVLALLDNPAVSEKFEMTPEDRELIQHWIDQTFIKWGIDEEHQRSFNLPVFDQNTWRHGLNRLLAGMMFDGRNPQIYEGILPYGDIESDQTEVLGRFLMFWEKLLESKMTLNNKHSLETWCGILKTVITDYFPATDGYRNEHDLMNKIISGLFSEQEQAGCATVLEMSVMRSYLRVALGRSEGSAGFLSGGVSFCAMLPMRSIPFAVVCLLGMNSDAYPRREGKTGFNMMENERRAGDRSVRNDDRYLFLESMLSARKFLIISYIGLSQTDNSVMLPSVLVSDFTDYLDRNYFLRSSRNPSEELLRTHPLHAFSPAYFMDEKKLFSYSKSNYLSARAIIAATEETKLFLRTPLVLREPAEKKIKLQDLTSFYMNPVQYFLEHQLRLKLPDSLRGEAKDSEPFRIDGLNAYQIKKELVKNRLQAGDDRCVFEKKRAEGALPVGAAGDYLFHDVRKDAAAMARDITELLKSPPLENLTVDFPSGDFQLCGALEGLHRDYRIAYRPAKLKTKDYLNAWIAHVILNAADVEDYPRKSILVGEDGSWRFAPLTDAAGILNVLIQYFRKGQAAPLKFFARSSWAYASALWQKNKSMETALNAAQRAWSGDDSGFTQADSEEMACRICFSDIDPIDAEFQKTADDILRTLFVHMEKAKI